MEKLRNSLHLINLILPSLRAFIHIYPRAVGFTRRAAGVIYDEMRRVSRARQPEPARPPSLSPSRSVRIYSSRHANTNGCSRNIDVGAINISRDLNHKLNPQTNPPANSCFQSVPIRCAVLPLYLYLSFSFSARRIRLPYISGNTTEVSDDLPRRGMKRGLLVGRAEGTSPTFATSTTSVRKEREVTRNVGNAITGLPHSRVVRARDAFSPIHRETHRRAFNE